jgi:hypothetical protein
MPLSRACQWKLAPNSAPLSRMKMRRSNALNSADPVHLGAQIVLLGVAEPIGIEAVLAAPNGGSARGY